MAGAAVAARGRLQPTSGLEGELVDLTGPKHRPAATVIIDLMNRLRPQLEAAGDWDDVADLTRYALASGTSAARQRKSLRQRGRLSDVVDQLIADTAADSPRGGGSVNSG